jgi:hypothetical protein
MPRQREQGRERYPSGKLKPKPETTMSPTLIRRMVDQAKAQASNPLLGSELGQLRLGGIVSDREVAAGLRYAEIVANHHRLKGIPSPQTRGVEFQGGMGLSLISDPDPEVIERATKQYAAARAVLARFGSAVISAVETIAVFDRPIVSTSQPALSSGLSALALHFGLTNRAR